MTPAKKGVLVWHDHWQVYLRHIEEAGLADSVDFKHSPKSEIPNADALAKADCMLAGYGYVPAGVLGRMPSLKWVQTVTVGVDDWFALPDLNKSVSVVCARGVHRIQMPESILGALFYATKPFEQARRFQEEKIWADKLVSMPLAGRTLGIIGLGAIGSELARKARALELKVVGTNRSGAPVPNVDMVYPIDQIEQVLSQSDFVVLLIPATAETDRLMNAERFSAMKQGAWLLNFARGHVVDDDALLAALHSGHLGGAVLDAFREEPLPVGHPFWDEPKILILPHLGGKHPARDEIVAEIFTANLGRYLKGEPLQGIVDRAKGY